MKIWQLAGSTAVSALMFGSGIASAQVTPEEVWQNWQDMSTSYGQTITSTSAVRDGDTLRVEGASIATDDGAGSTVNVAMGTLNFKDLGDGTVELTMADSYPISIKAPAVDDTTRPTDITITVTQPGMKLIAGGTPTETSYAFSAPTISINVDEAEKAATSTLDNNVDITLSGVEGKYLVVGTTETKTIDSTLNVKNMGLVVAAKGTAKDITKPFELRLTANVADLTGTTKGTFLGVAAMENMAEALKAGLNIDGGFSYGKTTFDMLATDAAGPTKVIAAADSGNFTIAIDKSRLAYSVGGKAMAMSVSSPDIPFPELKVTYAEALFNLLMPVSKSDVPEDFAFTTKLVDFAISDEVWAMFDPTGGLPHDPATIIIDTKGKAKLIVDITDEAATAALGEAPPGELHALDLTEIKVKAAGAELTGTGSLTFDNTDLTTFPGMPVPTGVVDMKIVGANTLLDKLIAMGYLPEDQALGFRMMAGMFTTVAEGEDTLTSKIEFKDKGVFANGQRLQ
jgi:hypothetical protein